MKESRKVYGWLARILHEAVGRAARFACDDVVRLPERKVRPLKGLQPMVNARDGLV